MNLCDEDQEILNLYNQAPKALTDAIADLGEDELNLSRAHGKWTIREIVHHIIECDLNYFQINRYALANSGAPYVFNEFDPHIWKQSMEHAHRMTKHEVRLFEMLRSYITYLCELLPGSMDRVLVHENGRATVREALQHDINHAYHHIEQIYETRNVHNL